MPDLLTHVLATYAVGVGLATARPRLDRYVGVAVIGAMLPDLAKAELVLDAGAVSNALGVPFTFWALQTVGGLALAAMVVSVWAVPRERVRVFAALVLAGGGHLLLDALIVRADGLVPPYGYPLTWWQPPIPGGGLYLSSDMRPLLVAIGATGVALGVRRAVSPAHRPPDRDA